MALVQPQQVQPGGVAVMPDYTTTQNSRAIKTKGVIAAEGDAEAAKQKQLEAIQDQADLDAQREWAEGQNAELAAKQAEEAALERERVAAEREDQLQLKRASQRSAEEEAENKAKLGDYWDTQSTPKRIFAALMMGLSQGEQGGAADIYKDASARFRQKEIDTFNAAKMTADRAGRDTANHEQDTQRFMLALTAKETARDNILKKNLEAFTKQQPKSAVAAAKLIAETDANHAKNKIAQENIYKRDWSQSVVEGKAAPGGPASAPTPKDITDVVEANARKEKLAEFAKFAKDNPSAVEEARQIRLKMVKSEAMGDLAKKGRSLGIAIGAVDKTVYDSASPGAKRILDAQSALLSEKVRENSQGTAPSETDVSRAKEDLAFHSMDPVDLGARLSASAKNAENVANALNANSKAGQAATTLSAAAPVAPKAPEPVDRKKQVRALRYLKANEKELRAKGVYDDFRKENGL